MELQRVESHEIYTRIPTEENRNDGSHFQQKWWHIDKKMIRFKLHYFLLTGALGLVHPFLAVIARDRLKLSATSFATVLVSEQFLFVFTKPAIGYITDYSNKLKTVLCIVAIGQVFFFFILLILPSVPKGIEGISNSPLNETHALNAWDLCENLNTEEKLLKIFENSAGGFESKMFSNESCAFLSDQISNMSQNLSFVVPSKCQITINSSLVQSLHNGESKLENKETSADSSTFSCSWYFKTFECPHTLTNSCAILVNNCILCFKPEKSYYYIVDASNPGEISRRKTDFETYQFWIFALVFITLDACINAIFTLSDTACCESLGKNGADYGQQRLWGSIAWGLLAPVGGAITDFTGDYIATGIIFAILSTIMIWNISKLNLVKPKFSKDITKNIGTILKEKEFLCFELGVFVNGIGLGFIWFYLIWFLTSMGGDRLLCGLTQTVQCFLGEIPFMFFSGRILKKVGYMNIMVLSLLAYCVRFLWYSQLQNPWLVLPIEWTHGITYGLFYASLATYAKMKAKPGTEATMQSVIAATYDGLGAGIGNIIAGVGFDYIGAEQTFLCVGICFGFCAVISLCETHLLQKKRSAANEET
ncbi:hypothetical protein AVEN_231316-1 [Araneus ventricosus]|uniref:Major facilitator superfamily associated domain-containing protein n=1 Tax=Araneus ventricosus TaxID=182803 RepID=A0A4Y2CIV3_ARAVE|nr:hypothetical protein AVEN_231316-1 [Araneus ventricosus]